MAYHSRLFFRLNDVFSSNERFPTSAGVRRGRFASTVFQGAEIPHKAAGFYLLRDCLDDVVGRMCR